MRYFGLLLFLFISCTNSGINKKVNTINISKKTGKIEKKLSEIAEDAFIITIKEAMIDRIEEIQITKNFVFILAQNGFFRFDHNGTFINQIGRNGKGPGEYGNVVSFTIDKKRQNAYLLSGRRILKYTYNGKLLKSSPFINGLNNIIYFDNQIFCSYAIINSGLLNNQKLPALIVLSDELEVIEKRMTQESHSNISQMFAYTANLYTFNNKLNYHPPFSDTIFCMNNRGINVKYLFDIETKIKKKYPGLFVQGIIESNKKIYCNIIAGNKLKVYIYNKNNGRTCLLKASKDEFKIGFYDDLFSLPPFVPKYFKNTEYVADIIYGYEINKSLPAFKKSKLKNTDIFIRVIKL